MNSKLLREGLNQIKKRFGLAVFHEDRKTIALFSDFVPDGRLERNALKHTYDSGAMRILLSATENLSDIDLAMLQAVEALKQYAFMDEEIAHELVAALCHVLRTVERSTVDKNDMKESLPAVKSKAINDMLLQSKRKELQAYTRILVSTGFHSAGVSKAGKVCFSGIALEDMTKKSFVSNFLNRIKLGKDGYAVARLLTPKSDYSRVRFWEDIVEVAVGSYHIVGRKKDGTVVACGSNSAGQCNVSKWKDIVKVSCGIDHTVGLKSDGTVLTCGYNSDPGCNISSWKDIIDIECGDSYTIGLRKNGTVISCKNNRIGGIADTTKWSNVVKIRATHDGIVGITETGKAIGGNFSDEWNNLADVAHFSACFIAPVVGLKNDGHVVVKYENKDLFSATETWDSIIEISQGSSHIVGLMSDGSVVACGNNQYGQCNVDKWRDIIYISCGLDHTMGLKKDGTVVACGGDGTDTTWLKDKNGNFTVPSKKAYTDGTMGIESWRLFE